MKTVGQVTARVIDYLQTTFPSMENVFGTGQQTIGDILATLALQGVNNARKWAERELDFELADVSVSGTVPANGSLDWTGELVSVDDTEVKYRLKSLTGVYAVIEGQLVPMVYKRKSGVVRGLLRERESDVVARNYTSIYQSDEVALREAYVQGSRLRLMPNNDEAVEIVLDGFRWLDDYQQTTDTDFLVEHGFDFLMWRGVVEANHLVKQFVPRVEGNLPPPTGLADAAWESLVKWNDFLVDTGRRIDIE